MVRLGLGLGLGLGSSGVVVVRVRVRVRFRQHHAMGPGLQAVGPPHFVRAEFAGGGNPSLLLQG